MLNEDLCSVFEQLLQSLAQKSGSGERKKYVEKTINSGKIVQSLSRLWELKNKCVNCSSQVESFCKKKSSLRKG